MAGASTIVAWPKDTKEYPQWNVVQLPSFVLHQYTNDECVVSWLEIIGRILQYKFFDTKMIDL